MLYFIFIDIYVEIMYASYNILFFFLANNLFRIEDIQPEDLLDKPEYDVDPDEEPDDPNDMSIPTDPYKLVK